MPRKSKRVAKTGTGFIGFGGASAAAGPSGSGSATATPSVASLSHAASVNALPPHTAVMFRKLAKKDKSTQVKGLAELAELTAGGDVGQDVLEAWVDAYLKLYVSDSRKVRVQLNVTLGIVAAAAKKRLASVVRRLMGPWLCALSDPSPDVAAAAAAAFDATFPPDKRDRAVQFTGKAVLSFLAYNLELSLDTLRALQPMSKADARVQLVTIKAASVGALAQLVSLAEPATLDKLDILTFLAASLPHDTLAALVTAPEPAGHGPAAVLRLFKAVATRLTDAIPSVVVPHAPVLLAPFAPHATAAVVAAGWDALLALLSAARDAIVDALTLDALFDAVTAHTAAGPSPHTLPSLLPLVALALPSSPPAVAAHAAALISALAASTPALRAPSSRPAPAEATALELAAYVVANHPDTHVIAALLTPWLAALAHPDSSWPARPRRPLAALFRAAERAASGSGAWAAAVAASWPTDAAVDATVDIVELVAADAPAAAATVAKHIVPAIVDSGADGAPLLARILATGVVDLSVLPPHVASGEWIWDPLAATIAADGPLPALALYAPVLAVYASPSTAARLLDLTPHDYAAWAAALDLAPALVAAADAATLARVTAALSAWLASPTPDAGPSMSTLAAAVAPALTPHTALPLFTDALAALEAVGADVHAGTLTLAAASPLLVGILAALTAAAAAAELDDDARQRGATAVFWFHTVQHAGVADAVADAWELLVMHHELSDALVETLLAALWDAFRAAALRRAAALELPTSVDAEEWLSPFVAASLVFHLVAATRSKALLDTFTASALTWPAWASLDPLLAYAGITAAPLPRDATAYATAAEAYVGLAWWLALVVELVRMMSFGMVFSVSTEALELGDSYVAVLAAARLLSGAAPAFEEWFGDVDAVEPKSEKAVGKSGRIELDLDSDTGSAASVRTAPPPAPASMPTTAELVARFVAECDHDTEDAEWHRIVGTVAPRVLASTTGLQADATAQLLADLVAASLDTPARIDGVAALLEPLWAAVPAALATHATAARLAAVLPLAARTLPKLVWRSSVVEPVLSQVAAAATARMVVERGLVPIGKHEPDLCLAALDALEPGTASGPLVGYLLDGLGDFKLLGIQHAHVRALVDATPGWKGVIKYIGYAARVGENSDAAAQAWAWAVAKRGLNVLRAMRKDVRRVHTLAFRPEAAMVAQAVARVVAWLTTAQAAEVAARAECVFGVRKGEDVKWPMNAGDVEVLRAVYCVASAGVRAVVEAGGVVAVGAGVVSRFVSGMEAWSSATWGAMYGHLLAWRLVLDHAAGGSREALEHVDRVLLAFSASLNVALSLAFSTLDLDALVAFHRVAYHEVGAGSLESLLAFGATLFVDTLEVVPRAVRQWWRNAPNNDAAVVLAFVKKHVAPALIDAALDEVAAMETDGALSVKVVRTAGTAVATYVVDEVKLELELRIGAGYPLEKVEIVGDGAHHGIPKGLWRRWMLSLNAMLESRLASLKHVVEHWADAVRSRFDGVEECAVCYYVVSYDGGDVPSMQCGTCTKRFHPACLLGWFETSQASSCPLCRAEF